MLCLHTHLIRSCICNIHNSYTHTYTSYVRTHAQMRACRCSITHTCKNALLHIHAHTHTINYIHAHAFTHIHSHPWVQHSFTHICTHIHLHILLYAGIGLATLLHTYTVIHTLSQWDSICVRIFFYSRTVKHISA